MRCSGGTPDQNGEKQTDFFNIVCWRSLADNCGKYLTKGSKAGVHGSIQNRSYEDKQGNRRTVTEIIADEVEFLSRKVETQAPAYQEITDNELPFLRGRGIEISQARSMRFTMR